MVIIYKNSNGDTRIAKKDVSFKEFQEANDMHIQDVRNIMNELALKLMVTGATHDYTKKSDEKLFYKNFLSTINNNTDFVNDEWYQLHIKNERHHLLSRCPEDVNLIDILEMITDCVCAGMARSGDIRPIEIDDDILNKALVNTTEMIKNMINVK
ncbi:DUF5662 family protein [Clostridioides difficile]|uniref:DUF5662 family protein n=1 Tax=Clostridioides difficile TaxID=1496 RepID=UPI00038D30C0|nr:DUF5662 family protein [Clostridioides difficile]EQJ88651.1 hypothetical protein QUC_3312 [Clostridioides difficile P50]MCO8835425.1 hypothetical protein [Clostridioides difficile]MCR1410097.1 DUF5662 family protein [Clostridioides difficile]MCR1421086.1 DUF5662 family protein [Clostridioides difficile]MDI0326385.1 DUF5662 family protein [Clostridioides difficile]